MQKFYKDMRTGEVVKEVPILQMAHFEEVVTTNGDTAAERDEKAEFVQRALYDAECSLEDIEDIIGDGDFIDYI